MIAGVHEIPADNSINRIYQLSGNAFKLLSYITSFPNSTHKDICDNLNISKQTLKKCINELVENKLIVYHHGKGVKNSYFETTHSMKNIPSHILNIYSSVVYRDNNNNKQNKYKNQNKYLDEKHIQKPKENVHVQKILTKNVHVNTSIVNMRFRKFMKRIGITTYEMQTIESKCVIDIDKYLDCIIYDYEHTNINNVVGWLIRCVDGTYCFDEHVVMIKKRRDKVVDESIKRDRERYELDRVRTEQVRSEQDDIVKGMSEDDRERIRAKLCKRHAEQFVLDVVVEGEYIREQREVKR